MDAGVDARGRAPRARSAWMLRKQLQRSVLTLGRGRASPALWRALILLVVLFVPLCAWILVVYSVRSSFLLDAMIASQDISSGSHVSEHSRMLSQNPGESPNVQNRANAIISINPLPSFGTSEKIATKSDLAAASSSATLTPQRSSVSGRMAPSLVASPKATAAQLKAREDRRPDAPLPRSSSASLDEQLRIYANYSVCYDSGAQELLIVSEKEMTLHSDAFTREAIEKKLWHPLRADELAARDATVRKHDGIFIFCSQCHMDQSGAHFLFVILPLISEIRRAIAAGFGAPTILINDLRMTERHAKTPLWERKLLQYVATDAQRLASWASDFDIGEPVISCFQNFVLSDFHLFSQLSESDFTYFRKTVARAASTKRALYEHCGELALKQPVVWILSRRVWSRKTLNVPELVQAVQHAFKGKAEVRVFDTPNMPCRGCLGYSECPDKEQSHGLPAAIYDAPNYPFDSASKHRGSGKASATCLHGDAERDVDYDIALFNNITLLVSVHGAGLSNCIFMPRGSSIVEIMPYGVRDDSYVRLFRRLGVEHVRYDETDDSEVVAHFGRRMLPSELWTPEHRGTLKGLGVRVNTSQLFGVLQRTAARWSQSCAV
ncbi:Protein O-linked-mannose beta-1,4-N-acetylglucosaminyltransferase 2 [Porphyridium purpureum]|uniref:Protein O-linked-mannose beta-1,4-N-acetylglucosaminyltransferase 2 n=1 Tax=Porphyridium purpureum TaxID=35688 RepID=A0A5J4YNL3_PORPP|nr:Protein O-linked-mannose beta-1,4-N-acetylglucosaminyltransferase 2 [Porphyridium purpureum]|eukprot:POR4916..scf296_7